jgi:hypothetical protein
MKLFDDQNFEKSQNGIESAKVNFIYEKFKIKFSPIILFENSWKFF